MNYYLLPHGLPVADEQTIKGEGIVSLTKKEYDAALKKFVDKKKEPKKPSPEYQLLLDDIALVEDNGGVHAVLASLLRTNGLSKKLSK